MQQRRRIDRILSDDYLDDLESRSTDEIRQMRDECEEEEAGISYARRVIQGRLDILRAEALRRQDDSAGGADVRSLLDALPKILGDERSPAAPDEVNPTPLRPRVSRFLVPPNVRYHRRDIDRIADDDALAALPQRPTEELTALVEEIREKERDLSARRQRLFERIDALQDELARRYKQGQADVGDVLRR